MIALLFAALAFAAPYEKPITLYQLNRSLADVKGAIETLKIVPKKASVAVISVSPVVTTTSQLLIAANPNRIGLLMYNNSANSIYIAYGAAANSANKMSRILATFTQFAMEPPIYTGPIYGIRNSGTGTVLVTELTE